MPTWRHSTHGTVVTTTAAMGADWELADPPSTPVKAPVVPAPVKKAAPKKAVPKTTPPKE